MRRLHGYLRAASLHVFKSTSVTEIKMGFQFLWLFLWQNNSYPSCKPLTVVILCLLHSPSLLPPSCSSSTSLPCVCSCFRAWQEAQIRGLKLDQIFSGYRFLRVPGFPTSSTQQPSILLPFHCISLLVLSSPQSQTKLCALHAHIHTHTHGVTATHVCARGIIN